MTLDAPCDKNRPHLVLEELRGLPLGWRLGRQPLIADQQQTNRLQENYARKSRGHPESSEEVGHIHQQPIMPHNLMLRESRRFYPGISACTIRDKIPMTNP